MVIFEMQYNPKNQLEVVKMDELRDPVTVQG